MFRALVVEDQTLMRLALMNEVQASFEKCVVLGAETLNIATVELQNNHFDLVVIDQIDHMQIARHVGLAGLGIDLDTNFVFAAVAGLGGALHRFFHGAEYDRLVDRLVTRHRVRNLQKFQPVCSN